MLTTLYIRIAELSLVLLLSAAVILAWREARSDRAELQSQLAAANQALAAATARQQDRDTKLSDVLASIAAQKKAPATNDQLLAGISSEAGLPTALTLQPTNTSPAQPPPGNGPSTEGNSTQPNTLQGSSSSAAPSQSSASSRSTRAAQTPEAPAAQIPAADLRPLYNYLLDCKACQAKLTAAQSDLADEKSKTATLTKSRDDAVRAAKGGSIWQRTLRAAKWFAIGAAAGAVAAKAKR